MKNSGISLIENLVVLTIVSVTLLFAISSFQDLILGRRLEGRAAEIATDIQFARAAAVAQNRPLRITFQTDQQGSCYLLHTGSSAGCTCTSQGGSQCSDATASILKSVGLPSSNGVHLEANVSSLLFDAGRGTVSPAGTIELSATTGQRLRQIVNIVGRTRTCSPDSKVSGYRAC